MTDADTEREKDLRESPDLMESLRGKRIAIVGNATSILAHAFGQEIEEHDVVLRMNNGLPVRPASQGARTDVLAFSVFSLVATTYPSFLAKRSIWMSPRFRETIADVPPEMTFYDLACWRRLHDRLGARPSVGAMALELVSRADPKTVSVYGFDFKQSGTFYEPHQHIGPHDYDAERIFCEELTRRSGWSFNRC